MKKIIVGLLVAGLLAGAYYYYSMSNEGAITLTPNPSASTESQTTETSELATVEKYTLEEVASHSSKEDCWLVLDGKIYDVTPYVQSGFHPGKEAILMGCGKDATSLFNNRPNGSGSHSERARKMLSKYYKGELAQ